MNSLRAKLLILLISITSLAWLATALSSYIDAHHEIDELFDAQLAQSAKTLLALADHELEDMKDDDNGVVEEMPAGSHEYERKIAFQIWSEDGRLLLRSANAPSLPMSGRRKGFDETEIGGERWRVYVQRGEEGKFHVQVGEHHEVRAELAGYVTTRLLLPLAVALPVLALLIWLAIGRGLAPLRRISNEVAMRDPTNLAALETSDVPVEILPLVGSLNTLLVRLEQALTNERRFTADAAHELRTPLAALKTQAQVARRADNASQRDAALENLILGTDRATHLVEQLLTLARLDPEGESAVLKETCDLAALARRILADQTPTALSKHIELELTGLESVPITGNSAMLGILLRNLVDNAIRYTPSGGRVAVSVVASRLEVTDSGPGIPEQEKQRVFDRFYRVLGTEASGSGLGLSIVQRIVDLHGAKLILETGEQGKGLSVIVVFHPCSDSPYRG